MEHDQLLEALVSVRDELRTQGERLQTMSDRVDSLDRALRETHIGVGANHHAVDEKIEEQKATVERLRERHDKHGGRLNRIEKILKLKPEEA